MATITFLEEQDDSAVTSFQFDQTGGTARGYYFVSYLQPTDVQDAIQDIIGYTRTATVSSIQGLNRIIPRTHPRFPYLYASRIVSVQGIGASGAINLLPTDPATATIGGSTVSPGARPITLFFKYYSTYRIGVEFAARPYPILFDSSFTSPLSSSWYTKDGTFNNFTYSPEWARYVDYDYYPQDNTIQGQVGSMSLIRASDTVPFTNPPWMWLPDQMLVMKWYQVPYRFIISTNSYIANRGWRGRVNQNQFWNWPPGSLLYLSFKVTKYTPPANEVETMTNLTGQTTLAYSRLCDIEFNFLYTNRVNAISLGVLPAGFNMNFIPKGHNLLPELIAQNFYYATRSTSSDRATALLASPAWYSAPFEALFSDPDATGGPTTLGDT